MSRIFFHCKQIWRFIVWRLAKLILKNRINYPGYELMVWYISELKVKSAIVLANRAIKIRVKPEIGSSKIDIEIFKLLLKFRVEFFLMRISNLKAKNLLFSVNRLKGEVSIGLVVVTHGYNPYLSETLDSVSKQIRAPDETVIINSGNSEDQIKAEITASQYNLPNLRIIKTHSMPAGYNRNLGAVNINSSHIVFLDGDDLLKVKALEVFWANLNYSNENYAIGSTCFLKPTNTFYHILPKIEHSDFFERNQLQLPSIIEKECIAEINGFRDSAIFQDHQPEDWDFWFRLTKKFGPLVGIRDVLHIYRVHALSTSSAENPLLLGKNNYWKYAVNTIEDVYWKEYDFLWSNFDDPKEKIEISSIPVVFFDNLFSLEAYLSTFSSQDLSPLRAFIINGDVEGIHNLEENYLDTVSIFCLKTTFISLETGLNYLSGLIAEANIEYVEPKSKISLLIKIIQRKSE